LCDRGCRRAKRGSHFFISRSTRSFPLLDEPFKVWQSRKQKAKASKIIAILTDWPGKPQPYAVIDSLNGRQRNELFNDALFTSLSPELTP
jgi:hypothetical protein